MIPKFQILRAFSIVLCPNFQNDVFLQSVQRAHSQILVELFKLFKHTTQKKRKEEKRNEKKREGKKRKEKEKKGRRLFLKMMLQSEISL